MSDNRIQPFNVFLAFVAVVVIFLTTVMMTRATVCGTALDRSHNAADTATTYRLHVCMERAR